MILEKIDPMELSTASRALQNTCDSEQFADTARSKISGQPRQAQESRQLLAALSGDSDSDEHSSFMSEGEAEAVPSIDFEHAASFSTAHSETAQVCAQFAEVMRQWHRWVHLNPASKVLFPSFLQLVDLFYGMRPHIPAQRDSNSRNLRTGAFRNKKIGRGPEKPTLSAKEEQARLVTSALAHFMNGDYFDALYAFGQVSVSRGDLLIRLRRFQLSTGQPITPRLIVMTWC